MKRRNFSIPLSLIIFVAALCFGFLLTNWSAVPTIVPDSQSYLDVAKAMLEGNAPSLLYRTISYPLFLLPFQFLNALTAVVVAQLVVGALGMVALFLILQKLSAPRWLAAAIALLCSLDYSLVSFQGTILTEGLAPALLLVSLYLHLLYFEKPFARKLALGMLAIDLFLVFLRPNFALVPLLLYVAHGVAVLVQEGRLRKDRKTLFIAGALVTTLAALTLWSTLNYRQNGYFGITAIAGINALGKAMDYGYLGPEHQYSSLVITEMQRQAVGADGPYTLLQNMNTAGKRVSLEDLKVVNRTILEKHWKDHLYRSSVIMPRILTKPTREFYVPPPKYYASTRLFTLLEQVYTWLNPLLILGWIYALLRFLYTLWRKEWNSAFAWSLPVLIILYQVAAQALTSYSEPVRLRLPILPLVTALTLLFFAHAATLLVSIAKQTSLFRAK